MHFGDKESLIAAAAQCDKCLGWLEHCKAECCHVFTFYRTPRSDVRFLGDEVRMHLPLTPDLRKYYELHGARIEEGEIVVVPRAACEVSPTRLVVHMRCRELGSDMLCRIHDRGQPRCCRDFTFETAKDNRWVITPRCLYAYKLEALDASRNEPAWDMWGGAAGGRAAGQ